LGFENYSRFWPASQIRHRGQLHAGETAAKLCGGSAVMSTSENDGLHPHDGITSRRYPL
jgi:hypothetical protein